MIYAKERLLAVIKESDYQAPQVYEETIRYFLKKTMDRKWQDAYLKEKFDIAQKEWDEQYGRD